MRIAISDMKNNMTNYLNALRMLGAEPVCVDDRFDPNAFDGLLLPGGGDIDPGYYHAENKGSVGIDPELDRIQFAVLDSFLKTGKPIFGICRGHQLINVAFGGTLIQDLENRALHARDTDGFGKPGNEYDKIHSSRSLSGSFIETLYGKEFTVNSSHHQALDVPGEGMRIAQYSADGVVEAIFHETLPIWAVQWHPERMCFGIRRADTVDGANVLRFFIEKCEKIK